MHHEPSAHAAALGEGHAAPHVLSPGVLLGTWGALMALTLVTVAVARVDLGTANVFIALAVATVKASIVALLFMHLKYDHRFNLVVLVGSVFFAVLFGAFVVFDSHQYQPAIRAKAAAAAKRAAAPTPAPGAPVRGD